MQKSLGDKHELQRLQNHVLFMDSEFVPKDQKYALAQAFLKSYKNIPITIVVPYEKDDVTLLELESKINEKMPEEEAGSPSKIKLPQASLIKGGVDQQKLSLNTYKKQFGKKIQTVEVLPLVPQNETSLLVPGPQVKNQEKYQICLISLNRPEDVFKVNIQWKPQLDVHDYLRQNINSIYDCKLARIDIQFYALNIQVVPEAQFCSFRFNDKKLIENEEEFRNLVFCNSEAVYIAFLSLNSKMNLDKHKKPTKPSSSIIYPDLDYQLPPIKESALKNSVVDKNRKLVIQLENCVGIRLEYHTVRDYTIKFLLGILKVDDHYKKGLMVLDKIYRPDEYIKIFQHAFQMSGISDLNFIQAKVVTQRQLFLYDVQDEVQPMSYNEMIENIEYNGVYQPKLSCISAFINQGLFPKDHNELQEPLAMIIRDFLTNYFIQYHTFEQTSWKRYIKSMLQEMETLPVYHGWVYRIVNYVYDRNVKHVVNFTNFIVCTKREDKVKLKLKLNKHEKNTVFKIKSTSGRAIQHISALLLDEVIFAPYSSFQIIRKVDYPTHIQYELEEVELEKTENRYNLLVWVDDKLQEGKDIFQMLKIGNFGYPIYLFQVASTKEFESIILKNQKYFRSPSAKKIIISNMKRIQDKFVNERAGVDTFKLAKREFKENWHFLYYIGYVQGTQKKLIDNGVKLQECLITNSPNDLCMELQKLCAWEQDIKKTPHKKYSNIVDTPVENWGDVFSTFKHAKSSDIK